MDRGLIAARSTHVSPCTAERHYRETPSVRSDAEYEHYLSEAAWLLRSMKPDDQADVLASKWGLIERARDYRLMRHDPAEASEATAYRFH